MATKDAATIAKVCNGVDSGLYADPLSFQPVWGLTSSRLLEFRATNSTADRWQCVLQTHLLVDIAGSHHKAKSPYRKSPGTGAKLCYMGHVLMENRHGLVVDTETTRVSGHAERLAALAMVDDVVDARGTKRITIGADKGYDTRDFIDELRERGVTPHVAQNQNGRRSAIDGRTTRHPGYAVSLRIRKRVEEVFGWSKSSAGQGKTRFRGLPRVRFAFTLTVAAYNLIRLPKLLEAT